MILVATVPDSPSLRRSLARKHLIALKLAFLLLTTHRQSARAGDHVDYRYEDYSEENGRMRVQTHALAFGFQIHPAVELQGEMVYDALSGATPYGALPTPGSKAWLTEIHPDERKAGNIAAAIKWGDHTTTPQFAYSIENDYESFGVSVNHSIDLNEKNTTLIFGVAGTHDSIFANTLSTTEHKDSVDLLVGVNQLLGPKTVLTANFTFGIANGYLNDPYKSVHIPFYPDPLAPDPLAVTFGESRPDRRQKEIGFVSLTHFVTPLNGSVEASYRLYHDSYGILSHTVTLNWFQKIGKNVVLNPMFRFTDQSAAEFYMTELPGDPAGDPPYYAPLPRYYSSDYRLAELQSFTYGISATIKVKNRVSIDLGYKRYEMQGTDGRTSQLLFPKANVFSIGARVWF